MWPSDGGVRWPRAERGGPGRTRTVSNRSSGPGRGADREYSHPGPGPVSKARTRSPGCGYGSDLSRRRCRAAAEDAEPSTHQEQATEPTAVTAALQRSPGLLSIVRMTVTGSSTS